MPARIVGVATRFPDSDDLGQGFVVVDESQLATALGADAPGTAAPDELWLSAPGPSRDESRRARTQPPFASLELASRRDIQTQLPSQPLARGITVTLGAAGLIALAARRGRRLGRRSSATPATSAASCSTSRRRACSPGTLRNQLRAALGRAARVRDRRRARARARALAPRRLGRQRLGGDDDAGPAARLPTRRWAHGAVGLAVARRSCSRRSRADGSARATGDDPVTRRRGASNDARDRALRRLPDLRAPGRRDRRAPGPRPRGRGRARSWSRSGRAAPASRRSSACSPGSSGSSAGTARVLGTDLGLLDAAGAAAFRAAHVGLLDQHYARSLSADLTCRHTVALQLRAARRAAAREPADGGRAARPRRPRDRAGDRPGDALRRRAAARRGLRRGRPPAGAAARRRAGRRARRRQREVVYRLLGELVRDADATAADRQPRRGRGLDRRPARLHPRRPDRRAGAPRRDAARS